jgi:hypothetical protein
MDIDVPIMPSYANEEQGGDSKSRKNSILTDKSDLTCKELDRNAYMSHAALQSGANKVQK